MIQRTHTSHTHSAVMPPHTHPVEGAERHGDHSDIPVTERATWTMPEWMEPYRALITNTGGNEVEDLIDRLDNEDHLATVNLPVFTLAAAVQAQIGLLNNLHRAGLLRDSAEETERPSAHAAMLAIEAMRHRAADPGVAIREALTLAADEFEQAYGVKP